GKVLRSDSSTTNLFSEEVEKDQKHYCRDLKTNLKLRSSAKINTWT
ncbi:TAAR9 isoform 1, partial [Pan troglodytes]